MGSVLLRAGFSTLYLLPVIYYLLPSTCYLLPATYQVGMEQIQLDKADVMFCGAGEAEVTNSRH